MSDRAADRTADLEVGVMMAAVGYYVAAMGAVVAMLASEFGVPAESLSWVGSTFGAGLLIVAVLGPRLLRRGPRPPLLGSVIAFLLGTLLVALPANLILIFVGTALQSIAGSVMVLLAPMILTTNADVRLTRANAVASLVGVTASPFIGAIAARGVSGRLGLLVLVPLLGWLLWKVLASRSSRTEASPVATPSPAQPVEPTEPAEHARPAAVARRWFTVVMAVSVEFCYVVWGVTRLKATGIDISLAAILGITFSIGMTTGRFAGPWIIRRLPAVPFGASVAAAGTLLVALTNTWPTVAAGLVIAGLGVATLYPVTLSGLMSVPGLRSSHGASLGAFASGTAIVLAPVALASLSGVVDLRLAFLIPIPLLITLVLLHGRPTRTRIEPGFFEAEA
jgi:MFS family permease